MLNRMSMHVARLCLNLSLSLQFMVIDVTTAAARTSSTSALPPLGTGRQPFPRNDKRVGLRLVEKGVFVSQPAQKRSLENKPVECIPPLLQPWVSLYRSIPKIYAPFTDLDVAFTLVSAIFFTCLDYSFALVVQAATGWPLKETRMAAGSLATICHATVLVAGLGVCLLTERYSPSTRMEAHPLWWRDAASALIQFCTGYMLYDVMIQFIVDRWVPGTGPVLSTVDCIFLAHHAATVLYMTSTRLIRAGHMSAMMLMFLGELTAPIMNLLRISNTAATLGTANWLLVLHPLIEYSFALLYVCSRVFAGPACAVHLTGTLLFTKEGRKNVPVQLSIVWLAMCWGVMIGSLPWIKTSLTILGGGAAVVA